jgi:hypothetical protein
LIANHLNESLGGHVHLDLINALTVVLLDILFRHGECQNDINLACDQSWITVPRVKPG